VKLAVELRATEALGPGATVAGTVRVLEGGRSRSLSVALHYVERSPEYTHLAVTVPGPVLHTGDLAGGESFEFAIPLPADALPGQSLPHGRLYWAIDVKSDEPGFDTHAEAEVPTAVPAAV
jgi:hypothetical protein